MSDGFWGIGGHYLRHRRELSGPFQYHLTVIIKAKQFGPLPASLTKSFWPTSASVVIFKLWLLLSPTWNKLDPHLFHWDFSFWAFGKGWGNSRYYLFWLCFKLVMSIEQCGMCIVFLINGLPHMTFSSSAYVRSQLDSNYPVWLVRWSVIYKAFPKCLQTV